MTTAAFGGRAARGGPTSALALAVALALHGLAAVVLLRLDGRLFRAADVPVEIEVNEPPPPPPPPEVEPPAPERPPEPPAPTIAAKLVPRRPPIRDLPPRQPPPTEAPPPPNQDPPPQAAKNAPPVFGVTMSSVVSGEAAMAVAVGNTTMTKSRARATDQPAEAYAAEGTKPFEPAPEISAATLPHVLQEVNSDDVYPPDARNLGLEGSVELSIGIDEAGRVVRVRILRRAGHKFDEAAVEAMKKTVFSPARARDGHPIPFRLSYRFVFTIKN